MERNQWRQIKELCRTALTSPVAQREDFLTQACGDNEALRHGIETLLNFHLKDAGTNAGVQSVTTRLLEQKDEEMTPERWRRIEQIFQAAAECRTEGLAAFLDHACGSDDELRHEVEALLAFQQPAPSFIKGVIHGAAAAIHSGEAKSSKPRPKIAKNETMFVPGAILAGRYRIIGPLGRGGMGAVYRADDLKLGQPVALKFLTETFAQDGAMLARFHGEVRIARQVSHPNVCRVHDIGEVHTEHGGQHFLSMEYVDGEDLSSLLRRIGRLPSDKAVEISRHLCSGLAAAHEAGVLHRDLKPANVMIDGKGRARITDFGLAGLAEQFRGREVMAGTPAYMAPEQIAGKEVTVKSDIYALGLVLYEIFTGKRVFDAASMDELRRLHESSSPTHPSSWVKDIDPLVERVILRCLEKDPDKRPASAMQVAAALPGGDPLAAAIAAGETPSPEMVAAAPKAGALRPAVAIACLLGVLLVLAFLVAFSGKVKLHNYVPLTKSPEIQTERAREVITRLGYSPESNYSRYGFAYDFLYQQRNATPDRWAKLESGRIPMIYFWYTQSPRYLEQVADMYDTDPRLALDTAGMTRVSLDPYGRLIEFIRVPGQVDSQPATPVQPDWTALFSAAELAPVNFKPTASQWTPPVAYDARAAWEGVLPEHPDIPIRIEAAGYHNLPVYFQMVYPWSNPQRQESVAESRKSWAGVMLVSVVWVAVCLVAVWLTRRNLRIGRGDRSGAFKLASFVFVMKLAGTIFSAAHTPALDWEATIIFDAIEAALFSAGLCWIIYIALEPYVRRYWPRLLISWSRLMAGDLRDPMVGRDLLVGGLLGLFHTVGIYSQQLLPSLMGESFQANGGTALGTLRGFHLMLASIPLTISGEVISSALLTLFLLLLFYILLRREWLAAMAVWVLIFSALSLLFAYSWWSLPGIAIIAASMVLATFRFGLLAGMAWQLFFSLTFHYPLTAKFSLWYANVTFFCLLVLTALAAFGCHTSIGGQKLFKRNLLDVEVAGAEKP
jgi:serine/threonine-protein kinase